MRTHLRRSDVQRVCVGPREDLKLTLTVRKIGRQRV